MKNTIIVIPVRMGSSRFPGKPLKKILGKEMLLHITDNLKIFKKFLYVAGCDIKIQKFCLENSLKYISTSKKHKRASDRTFEAAIKISKKNKFNKIVMVQGDEPLVNIHMIKKSLKGLSDKNYIYCTNLISKINTKKDFSNPNIIKVIKNKNNNALAFSRSPIPYSKTIYSNCSYKQVCIISFTFLGLKKFAKLKPRYLEMQESVDMYRFLENGYDVKLNLIRNITHPVDVFKDIKIVEKILKENR